MTKTLRNLGLALAATAIAAAGAVGVHASPQNQNTNQVPPPFMGRGPGGRGGPIDGDGLMPMLPRELQLTDGQRSQIQTIAASHKDEWKALATRARTAHQSLMTAVTTSPVDETTIRAKSADVAAVEADMAVAKAHVYSEVWPILTTDQQTRLQQLRTQFSARRSGGRQ